MYSKEKTAFVLNWQILLSMSLAVALAAKNSRDVDAADRTWTAGNGTWNTQTNWDPIGVPNGNDRAIIGVDLAQPVFVFLNIATAPIDGLDLNNGASLNTNGRSLNIDQFDASVATITGAGTQLVVVDHNANGGVSLAADALVVDDGGTLNMQGGDVVVDYLLTVNPGSVIAGSGQIEVSSVEATSLFNSGSIVAAGGATLTLRSTDGKLFDLDGSSEDGVLEAADNAALVIDAPLSDGFDSDIFVGVNAEVGFTQTAVANPLVLGVTGSLTFAGGNSQFTGETRNLGQIDVISGTATFAPGSGLRNEAGANVRVLSEAELALSEPMTNVGTLELSSGTVTGAAISNSGQIVGNGEISTQNLTGTGLVSAQGGRLTIDTVDNNPGFFDFNSTGVVNAVDGDVKIVLSNGTTGFGGTLNVGTGRTLDTTERGIILESNASLNLDGGTYIGGGVSQNVGGGPINTSGAVESRIVSSNLSVLSSVNVIDGPLRLEGLAALNNSADFTGNGQLTIGREGRLENQSGASIKVPLINDGTVAPGRVITPSIITVGQLIADTSYTQTATGTLEIHIEDVGQFSSLFSKGPAELDGTLDVDLINGFEPALGDSFQILDAVSRTGTFSDVDLPVFGDNLTFDVLYSPTTVSLVVVGQPVSADVDNDGDVDGRDFVLIQKTTPSMIPQWQVEYGGLGIAASTTANVPEPQSSLLALLSIACYVYTRPSSTG